MGLRVKRYGPVSTMVVVGRLVGTFEPARVMVEIAHATSASARANTTAPSQPADTAAGKNGKGMSQLSASPASTASAHVNRRPDNDIRDICRVSHGGTGEPALLLTWPAENHLQA